MGTYLIIGLVLAIAAVLGFKRLARKGFEHGRTPLPLVDIHRMVQDQISISVFNEVWSKLGEAFSIDSKLIRPDDKLKTFASLDSWDLGRGEEALGQWLQKRGAGTPPTFETVLDLARWVEKSSPSMPTSNAAAS